MPQAKTVNVLLLGESGAGKSTFINSLSIYIKYDTLSQSLRNSPNYQVPAQVIIDKARNSRTQVVTDYVFEINNIKLRLIDTVGIVDTIFIKQEEEKVKAIVAQIARYGHLNAIAFVVNSDFTIKCLKFKLYIDHLFSQLDKAALQNVFFIFTHSLNTLSRPKAIMSNLQVFLSETGIGIPCSESNIFCLDNESFRFVLVYSNTTSWTQSYVFKNLIDYIFKNGNLRFYVGNAYIGKKTPSPQNFKQNKCQDNKLEELLKFLGDISCGLDENVSILQNFINTAKQDFKAIPLIYFEKAVRTGEAVYVCTSLKCTPLQQIAGRKIHVNKSFCALNTGNLGFNCDICQCPLNLHRYTKYMKKITRQTLDNNQRTTKLQNMITQISSFKYELECVINVLATLTIHKIQENKLTKDSFLDYFLCRCYENLNQLYLNNYRTKELTGRIMKLGDIEVGFNQLKKLDWTGVAIQNIFKDDLNLNTGVIVENQELHDAIELLKQQNIKLLVQQEVFYEELNNKCKKKEFALLKRQNVTSKNTERKTQEQIEDLTKQIETLKKENQLIKEAFGKFGNKRELSERVNKEIKQHNDEIKDLKEIVQQLSNEFHEIKEQFTKSQSTSNTETESEPKKFQKLIDDLNKLKKIKQMQGSFHEEFQETCNIESETPENLEEQLKFQKNAPALCRFLARSVYQMDPCPLLRSLPLFHSSLDGILTSKVLLTRWVFMKSDLMLRVVSSGVLLVVLVLESPR